MKRFMYVVILTGGIITLCVAHKQNVHQYISREAYLLLKSYYGDDIPIMKDHIGVGEIGDHEWQTGLVVIFSFPRSLSLISVGM